jgi:hypothetical protein
MQIDREPVIDSWSELTIFITTKQRIIRPYNELFDKTLLKYMHSTTGAKRCNARSYLRSRIPEGQVLLPPAIFLCCK